MYWLALNKHFKIHAMKKCLLSVITILIAHSICVSANAQAPQTARKFVPPKNRAELIAMRNAFQQQERIAEANRKKVLEEQARARERAQKERQAMPANADRPKQ